jgi:hypothetical protein
MTEASNILVNIRKVVHFSASFTEDASTSKMEMGGIATIPSDNFLVRFLLYLITK